MWTGKPDWVFELWAGGNADIYCATDKSLPINPLRRLFWRIRGEIVSALFSWWWWEENRLDMIEDGFGNSISAYCPQCGGRTMQIVRPGKFQCWECD